MKPGNKNSYNSLKTITINNREYKYYSLSEAEKKTTPVKKAEVDKEKKK